MHLGHYRPNFKWGRMWHTPPPSKDPTSSSVQHTHKRTKDNHKRSFLAHVTVRPVSAHVPCHEPRRSYTRIEPHVRAPNPHVAAKVGSDTICNALESKWLKSTLHAEWTIPTTIPLTPSSSLRVKGLTGDGGMDCRSLTCWYNPTKQPRWD
jgi:hypothetical protein